MDDFTRAMLAKSNGDTFKPNDDVGKYAPYEPPILVFVYQAGGVLSFVASIAAPFFLGLSGNPQIIGLSIFSGLVSSVGLFGLAQLVDLAGRTEFHARKLHEIEKHLERIVKG